MQYGRGFVTTLIGPYDALATRFPLMANSKTMMMHTFQGNKSNPYNDNVGRICINIYMLFLCISLKSSSCFLFVELLFVLFTLMVCCCCFFFY